MRSFREICRQQQPRVSPEAMIALNSITDASLPRHDAIAGQLNIQLAEKQAPAGGHRCSAADPTADRLLIDREQYIAELEKEIGEKVRSTIEKNQKEYYLREQIKAIQTELGEQEGSQEEQDRYLELLEAHANAGGMQIENQPRKSAACPACRPAIRKDRSCATIWTCFSRCPGARSTRNA